jgi:hypothetical protein
VIIFDPRLVEPFTNADDSFMFAPPEVACAFHSNPQTVGDFIMAMKDKSSEEKDTALLDARISHLDVNVGEYSIFRDVAVYREVCKGIFQGIEWYLLRLQGVRSKEAIRLSYM